MSVESITLSILMWYLLWKVSDFWLGFITGAGLFGWLFVLALWKGGWIKRMLEESQP